MENCHEGLFRALVWCCIGLTVSVGWTAELYVAQNGQTPAAPYRTWPSAASNIQDAVNAAAVNDSVWVGPGRYYAPAGAPYVDGAVNVVHMDKPLTIRSSSGPTKP